ncbi:MAG: asparagine synthase (glutamine-hydrolyzing) [Actinomycetota bacterium]|nr:asparagine synthase (glutamine-hydrolyzing) [Actinomycetota bacterium]
MCGIYGVFDASGLRRGDEEIVMRMDERLRHRGPDDRGQVFDASGGAAIGARRLSIIDLASGHQPMANEEGTAWVAYNGELYNYLDLRHQLQASGHVFRSRSDTEVVVHAYEEWGKNCVRRFNGMFAFAIWDQARRSLFLARDHLGVKPLYYWFDGKRLVFGSELKAILCDPSVPRLLDWQGLANYLAFGHAVAPVTMYRGIRKLPGGHHLGVDGGDLEVEQYWDPAALRPQASPPSAADAVDQLRVLLHRAVQRQMVADVPIGAFLSGGLDSTTVVALMSAASKSRATTFSVGYDGVPEKGELGGAQEAAAHFGTDHHELVLRRQDVLDCLEEILDQYDEPFGDAAAVPAYLLSRLARKHVKVVLTGEGGDELFGGYMRYVAERLGKGLRLLPPEVWSLLARHLGPRLGSERMWRLVTLQSARNPAHRHAAHLVTMPPAARLSILSPDVRSEVAAFSPELRYEELHRRAEIFGDSLNRVLYTDLLTWLPDTYLEKIDKASMAHGLEARVPLLDRELVEFVVPLPAAWKVTGGRTKRLLRRAMADRVPSSVLDRPKQGFGPWLHTWLREEVRRLGEDVAGTATDGPVLDRRALREALTSRSDDPKHYTFVWQIVLLHHWLERSGVQVG